LGGQRFGRYEILRPLGSGGMGEVLLARQSALPGIERLVVIKKVLPHLAREPGFLQRFLDETRVAASLSHGNIVSVYEVGEADGEYFMAMEYVEGMDLREVLHRLKTAGRRMPEDLALYILIEVAKGLSHAHEKRGSDGRLLGIVHRDVSPANLLLSFDGQVKLTDFGVAKAAMRLAATLPGTLQGKVYYMSPEQVSGQECDGRSDIFSLGVVAYEMLAGCRPFEGDSDLAVMDQVRRCAPRPLVEAAPYVPSALAARVERAMARDPGDRYPTMEAFRADLSTYLLEAHTMVSARALADFLEELRGRGPREAERLSVGPDRLPASLDDVAASLLGPRTDEGAEASRTRTLQAAPPAPSPAPSPPSRPLRRVGWVLAGLLGLAALGAWWWNRADGARPGEGATGGEMSSGIATDTAQEAQGPDAGSDAGIDARIDAGPEGPAPDEETRDEAAAPEPREGAGAAPRVAEGPRKRTIWIRTQPAGAEVRAGDRVLGRTPLEVEVPPTPLDLEVQAEGMLPRRLSLGPGTRKVPLLRLDTARGRVQFRFFPANTLVELDGHPVAPQGNLVDIEVPAGPHRLLLRAPDGSRRRVVDLEVPPGGVKALGTLELVEPPAPPPSPKEEP